MGSNTGIPGLSFSWKRATGLSKFKYNVARTTGIPTTRSGRQRKIGRLMTSPGGCLVALLTLPLWPILLPIALVVIFLEQAR